MYTSLKNVIEWLFLPMGRLNESAETIRMSTLLNGANFLSIVMLMIYNTYSVMFRHSDPKFDLFIMAIILINFIQFKIFNSLTIYKLITGFAAFLYCFSTFICGDFSTIDSIWSLLYPLFIYISIGYRIGTVLIILYALAFNIMYLVSNLQISSMFFKENDIFEFTLIYCFMAILSFILEFSRERAQKNYDELIKNLDLLSKTDELTGLFNRRGILEFLKYEFRRHNRGETHFAVCICDIDHFKIINDSYGHESGDMILKDFSAFIKNKLRAGDFISRWGGEEFIILMRESSIHDCVNVIERIRSLIERKNFRIIGCIIHITVSFGISESVEAATLDEMINLADKRLYKAKEEGRNRVVSG